MNRKKIADTNLFNFCVYNSFYHANYSVNENADKHINNRITCI